MTLNASIHTILHTRKGEKIGDYEYGCGVWDRLDRPAQVPLLVSDIVEAIERNEPRAKNVVVSLVSGNASGVFEFLITYDGGESRLKL